MPLQKQNITIPLGELGLDAGKHPHVASGLLQCENTLFTTEGAIKKRTGTKALSSTAVTNALVGGVGSTPFCIRDSLYYYANSSLTQGSTKGGLHSVFPRKLRTSRTPYYYIDYAQQGNYYAIAYVTYGATYSLYVDLFEVATHRLVSSTAVTTGSAVLPTFRLLAFKGWVNPSITDTIYLYHINGSNVLSYCVINTSTGTVGASTACTASGSLTNAAGVNAEFDVCRITNNDTSNEYVCIVYLGAANTGHMAMMWRGYQCTSSLQLSTSPARAVYKVACCAVNATQAMVAWRSPPGTYSDIICEQYGTNNSLIYGPTTAMSFTSPGTNAEPDQFVLYGGASNACYVYATSALVDGTGACNSLPCVYQSVITNGSVTTAKSLLHVNCSLATKPVAASNTWTNSHLVGLYLEDYLLQAGGADTVTDSRLLWMDPSGNIVAQTLAGLVRQIRTINHVPFVYTSAGDTYITAYSYILKGLTQTTYPDQLSRIELTRTTNPSIINLGDRAIIAGSVPLVWDGTSLKESAFLRYPSQIFVTAAGGGSMGLGDYNYKVVAERTDGNGIIYRSAPTPNAFTVTIGAGSSSGVVKIPTMSQDRNGSTISYKVYRTVASGTVYYYVGSVNNSLVGTFATFTDLLADASITGNERLYTDSGELENIHPFSSEIMISHQDRLVYVSTEDPETNVYYSKSLISGEPHQFNDSLLLEVPREGGSITALASLNDKLFIFKRNAIYVADGTGIDNYGQGFNYRQPVALVTPTVGCINHRSLAYLAEGVIFQGSDGLYLLSSSFQVQNIGSPVQYYLDTYGSLLTQASVVPDLGIVVFTFSGGTAPALIYDYGSNKWCTWLNHTATSCATINNKLHHIGTYLYQHDTSIFYDQDHAGTKTDIPIKVTTPWLSFANLGGYQRLYRVDIMGQHISAHTLTVGFAYDFNPYFADSYDLATTLYATWGRDQNYTDPVSDKDAYLLTCPSPTQKCTSFRVQVLTTKPSGETTPTEHLQLTALIAKVGIKPSYKPNYQKVVG